MQYILATYILLALITVESILMWYLCTAKEQFEVKLVST